jgi:hypothetical protein
MIRKIFQEAGRQLVLAMFRLNVDSDLSPAEVSAGRTIRIRETGRQFVMRASHVLPREGGSGGWEFVILQLVSGTESGRAVTWSTAEAGGERLVVIRRMSNNHLKPFTTTVRHDTSHCQMKRIGRCGQDTTSSGRAEGERYDHMRSYQLDPGARPEKLKLHNRTHTKSMEQRAGRC